MIPTPYPDSYWVIPGRFMAGEYPAVRYWEDRTRSKLHSLLDAGVRVFIDLTRPNELTPYEPVLKELSGWLNLPTEYYRHPIRDLSIPTPAEMTAILDRIDAALAAEKCVYVHCWGGIGRTGTVVGCHLVRRGSTGEQALAALRDLRRAVPDARPSPESDEQVEMVRDWK
jgi:hypothetical protein